MKTWLLRISVILAAIVLISVVGWYTFPYIFYRFIVEEQQDPAIPRIAIREIAELPKAGQDWESVKLGRVKFKLPPLSNVEVAVDAREAIVVLWSDELKVSISNLKVNGDLLEKVREEGRTTYWLKFSEQRELIGSDPNHGGLLRTRDDNIKSISSHIAQNILQVTQIEWYSNEDKKVFIQHFRRHGKAIVASIHTPSDDFCCEFLFTTPNNNKLNVKTIMSIIGSVEFLGDTHSTDDLESDFVKFEITYKMKSDSSVP